MTPRNEPNTLAKAATVTVSSAAKSVIWARRIETPRAVESKVQSAGKPFREGKPSQAPLLSNREPSYRNLEDSLAASYRNSCGVRSGEFDLGRRAGRLKGREFGDWQNVVELVVMNFDLLCGSRCNSRVGMSPLTGRGGAAAVVAATNGAADLGRRRFQRG
jgi:hypothetical protein